MSRQVVARPKRRETKGDRPKSDQKRQKRWQNGYQKATETEKSDLSLFASPLLRHSEAGLQCWATKGSKSAYWSAQTICVWPHEASTGRCRSLRRHSSLPALNATEYFGIRTTCLYSIGSNSRSSRLLLRGLSEGREMKSPSVRAITWHHLNVDHRA